jgi:hypothetical protein
MNDPLARRRVRVESRASPFLKSRASLFRITLC